MKLFVRDFLITFALTLLIGGAALLLILSLAAKPTPLDAKKPATWSIAELER
jgi:hypothetical protein